MTLIPCQSVALTCINTINFPLQAFMMLKKLPFIILASPLMLQACATNDVYIPDSDRKDKMVILTDYEFDPGGVTGQKYLIPAQTLNAVKHNEEFTIYIAPEGYSTVAVYGSTTPPLGFCVPKDNTQNWKLYINTCQAKLKTLPEYRMAPS